MTINEAKAIDMVNYLLTRGYAPKKIVGINYWYCSPFRDERTPSFKINRNLNRWYDFAEGQGGNLVDFIGKLDGITIKEVLQKIASADTHPTVPIIPGKTASEIEILSTHLISSLPLVRYLDARRIPEVISDAFLKEVRYKNADKKFFALGFKNDAGGYELRSPGFKGSSSPKSPTLIKSEAPDIAVFEGFFDFLSYLAMTRYLPAPSRDYLVLNSTSFFEQQLPIMQTYQRVHLYLDNDATGDKYTAVAQAISKQQFQDERPLYKGYKDLNDWLMHIGNAPLPAA